TAQIVQPAGADPIGASLVFLHLLKRKPDRFTEFFLTQAEHVSAESNAGADVNVDRVRLVAFSATRASGQLLHRHRSSTGANRESDLIMHAIDGGQQGVLTEA